MASDPTFDEVMARLRAGQNDAATQVFNRFAGRLLALARKRLDPLVLQKVDPEDVVQSVFRSFFACNAAGRFGEFESWDNVWGMLVVLTQWKCGRRMDYFHAACRNVDREVPAELTHTISNGVVGQDRVAFTLTCTYPTGQLVVVNTILDIRDGLVARQVSVETWDE